MRPLSMLAAGAAVVVACACAVLPAQVQAQAPNPPPIWPISFSATFGLYYAPPPPDAAVVNSTSSFLYNLHPEVFGQLIDYPAYCPASPALDGLDAPCKLLFNEAGIFFTQPSLGIPCCMMFADVGPTPRNFTRGFEWNGTASAADYYGEQHRCDQYVGGDAPNQFKYWTEIDTHHDIQFHDGGGANWQFARLNVTTVGAEEFDLFADKETCFTSCAPSFGQSQEEMQRHAAKHAPIALALHHHALKQRDDKWARHVEAEEAQLKQQERAPRSTMLISLE